MTTYKVRYYFRSMSLMAVVEAASIEDAKDKVRASSLHPQRISFAAVEVIN